MMGQRVDNLLKMMGDERDRMAGQQSSKFSLFLILLKSASHLMV
jgi:hypothetical protein